MALEASSPRIGATGPIHHYVEIPAYTGIAGAVVLKRWYLGTCETQPQISLKKFYGAVFNDLGGRLVPFQLTQAGQLGRVGLALTRFSQLALTALDTHTGYSAGLESELHRGQLVLGVSSVKLYQQYSFFGTAVAPVNLPPGRVWTAAVLDGYDIVESGSAAEKVLLAFSCFGLWDSTTLDFTTYSELTADFAADLVPQ